ncbi:helix-turn-helix domain-containing protein [Streptomyces scabiei]|uniref:helix-turn-helix domain-containing protein n=1 Tax=Streptomyces scabiei TaxID=1930 RepID=UPI0029A52A7B|nr:helix-turn-helix domain-containing protein [Streptomyces scabiei]MDX2800115.1 helix-turn-helix domain-containing protein [Streptomyces scabiei]MDX3125382.1 helix-turn-helix domain-containing protein [Streptomyces scabiei]MDX3282995.1 helix-turn-helix domain-containing protein [Streptomyces scabiei]
MSVEHMAMVFAAGGLDGSEKLLLLAYTNYTDPHGYCWPSEQRLADDCGTSISTVARQKRSLRKRGLLKSVRRINPRTGEPISNLSRINLPLLASMRQENRAYDDDMVQRITFDEPEEAEPDLLKCHSDGYPMSDRQVPPFILTGTPCQSDSQSLTDPPREPVEILSDVRRTSTSGSRGSRAGGCAASGKTNPPSHTREQRRQVDAFFQALPTPIAALVPDNAPRNLRQAVLDALASDRPEARTPQQLVEYRLMPKWDKHYASRDAAGPIEKPVGVLIAMLRRDRECGDARCDERTNVDTGQACVSCGMRAVDNRSARQQNEPEAPRPPARQKPVVIPSQVGQQRGVSVLPAGPADRQAVAGDASRGAALARGLMVDRSHRPR